MKSISLSSFNCSLLNYPHYHSQNCLNLLIVLNDNIRVHIITIFTIYTIAEVCKGRLLSLHIYEVQLLFICRKTNYFKKNYFTNFAKYMISLFLDIARESS